MAAWDTAPELGIVWLLLAFGTLVCACPDEDLVLPSSSRGVCSPETLDHAILGFPDSRCPLNRRENVDASEGVTEGDEASLQRALSIVYRNKYEFVAVLFYASWCPFSKICRPSFPILSSLYPSIPHFAIEESSVRPSTLSKYGVHGFPTLILLNSTMRMQYHGSRTLGSLIAFYGDVTGRKTVSLDQTSLEKMGQPLNSEDNSSDQECCPFSWVRSPENLLGQEAYLALASAFVLLRFCHYILPALLICAQAVWRRHIQNMSLWEHPVTYLNRSLLKFSSSTDGHKRRNLQGGAMNAKAWASKSLASVSIGDSSSG